MTKVKRVYFILFICFVCSCTKDVGKLPKVEVQCVVPSTVSFAQDMTPLFNAYCNTGGCHSGGSAAGNLNLEPAAAYAALNKSGSGYIDTVTPNFSLLYAQMISASSPMPPTGKLDDCKLQMVLKWIQQKAKNN